MKTIEDHYNYQQIYLRSLLNSVSKDSIKEVWHQNNLNSILLAYISEKEANREKLEKRNALNEIQIQVMK